MIEEDPIEEDKEPMSVNNKLNGQPEIKKQSTEGNSFFDGKFNCNLL